MNHDANHDPIDDPSGDLLDDLLTRALVSRADAARPGAGSLTDVHRRVRQRARRRVTVGAGALAGVGVLTVGVVLAQGDDSARPIDVADGNDQTEFPTDVERPGSTLVVATTTPGMPGAGAYRCSKEIAAPIDPTQPDVTPPGRWFETCEYVDVGTVSSTTIVPLPPTTGGAGSEGASPDTTASSTADLSGVRVLVANGSGVAGFAGSVASRLASLGASVADPVNATKNADATAVYAIATPDAEEWKVREATWIAESVFDELVRAGYLALSPGRADVTVLTVEEAAGLVDSDVDAGSVLIVLGRDAIDPLSEDLPACPSYTVEHGDFLVGIAERFNTTVDRITLLNRWPEGASRIIVPGEEISIPGPDCLAPVATTTSIP
jgi:LysM repeat protein